MTPTSPTLAELWHTRAQEPHSRSVARRFRQVPFAGIIAVLVGLLSANVGAQTYQYQKVTPGLAVTPTKAVTQVSANALEFAGAPVGSASTVQSLTLQNTSSRPAPLSIAVTAGFSVTSTTCGASLAAGQNCQYDLVHTPSQLGTRSGTLTITADGTAHLVALSGTGVWAATLATPSFNLFYEGKHPAWLNTGHDWAGVVSGYVSSAPSGASRIQALLNNPTLSGQSVTLRYSVDDFFQGLRLNGTAVSFTPCNGHTTLCTVNLTLPPGTSHLSFEMGNGSGPAGFSAWVTNGAGQVLVSTSNTSGSGAWTRY